MYTAWKVQHNKGVPIAHHTKSPYSREYRMKTAFQQQFDIMASGIIHEAIQSQDDVAFAV